MRLAFKTLIVAFGQLAGSMERILAIMILSRTLSKFDYGTYQQVWLFYVLILPLFMLGLPSSILYFIPRTPHHQHKTVILQTIFLLEAVGVIFSLGTILTAPLVAEQFNNPELVRYLRVFSLYPLFSLPPKMINLLMIAEDKPIRSAVMSALSTLNIVAFLTMPSIIGLPLIYTFYSANVGAVLFLIGVLVYVMHVYKGQRFQFDFSLLREQVAFSIPLGLASVVGTISLQLNKAVVSSSFVPEVYAVYSNGAFEIPVIGLLTGSLMTVLIPEFAARIKENQGAESVWGLWNAATTKTAIILFPIGVGLFIFAPEFMAVMFSAQYVESAPVFRVYLALAVLRITQYGALLQAMGKTRLIMITSIITLFINWMLSLLLLQMLGLLGPALANVISTYLWALISLGMICKLVHISFRRVMPWRELGKLMLLAAAAGVVVLPVRLVSIGYFWELLIGVLAYSLAYLSILLLTRTISVYSIRSLLDKALLQLRSYSLSESS